MADSSNNTLSFSTRVDLSGLRAGIGEINSTISTQMADAASAVADSSAEISSSFATLADASGVASAKVSSDYEKMMAQAEEAFANIDASTTKSAAIAQESAASNAAAVTEGAAVQISAYERLARAKLEDKIATQLLAGAYSQATKGLLEEGLELQVLAGFEEIKIRTSQQLAAAQLEVAAATEVATTATEGLAAASSHQVSQMAAASGAIRVFEGALPIRAVENFATKVLGLGPLLTAAFPLIGLIAVGEMAFEVGEKLAKAFDVGGERARATQLSIEDVNLELQRSSTALDVQIDKLAIEQAKLEHRPVNSMKLVMDEAALSAENLSSKLEGVEKRELAVIKTMAASLPQRVLGLGVDTKEEQTDLQEHAKWLGLAKDNQAQLNESISYGAVLQKQLADAEAIHAVNVARQNATSAAGSVFVFADNTNRINALKQQITWQQQEQAEIQKTIQLNVQQAATSAARDNKTARGRQTDPDRDELKAIQSQYAELNAASADVKGHKLTASEGAAFWEQYLTTFKAGSAEAKTVLTEYARAQDAMHAQLTSAVNKMKEEQQRSADLSSESVDRGMAEMNAAVLKQSEGITRTGAAWDGYSVAVAKSTEIQAAGASALQLATISYAESTGQLTALQAAQMRAGVDTDTYRVKIAALRAELEKLRAEQTNDPITGANNNPGNAKAQQDIENQIAKVQGQQSVSAITDQGQINQQITRPFNSAFMSVNSGFQNVVGQMIRGTRSISQAFANMGVDILVSGATWAEQWLAKKAETYAADKILYLVTGQSKVAADAITAAQQNAITATSVATTAATTSAANVGMATSYAAVAAAAAAAAVAMTPIVGPALAPAASAAVFAATIPYAALAAFESGTQYVPREGIAMLHPGEAVLGSPAASVMRDAFSGKLTSNDNSQRSSSITQHVHINGPSDAQFRKQMTRNSGAALKTVQRQVRIMGRA